MSFVSFVTNGTVDTEYATFDGSNCDEDSVEISSVIACFAGNVRPTKVLLGEFSAFIFANKFSGFCGGLAIVAYKKKDLSQ